jgi:hypothetical protein
MTEKLTVYWCPPGEDFNGGLVAIKNDAHIVEMIGAVKDHKVLTLYVDHTGFVNVLRPDVLRDRRQAKEAAFQQDQANNGDHLVNEMSPAQEAAFQQDQESNGDDLVNKKSKEGEDNIHRRSERVRGDEVSNEQAFDANADETDSKF